MSFLRSLFESPPLGPVEFEVAEAYRWNAWYDAALAQGRFLDSIPASHPHYHEHLAALRGSNAAMHDADPVAFGMLTSSWPKRHRDRRTGPGLTTPPWPGRTEPASAPQPDPHPSLRRPDTSGRSALQDLLDNRF